MKRTILIADDEKNIREGLALALDDYDCLLACDGEEAWKTVNEKHVDLVISDLRMPVMSGDELLKKINGAYPMIPVVVLTGHGTVEAAVDSMRNGAVDFLTKPVNIDHLELLIKRTFANMDVIEQNNAMSRELEELKKGQKYSKIIGNSTAVKKMMATIEQVAPTDSTVLITGESGVGKELVADAIHSLSKRKDGPFVKVNCSALAETLLESELFGHEKGAFTGAIAQKKGRFELADGGTIFLDEIGEINQSVQVKILRVLQEHEFERVGGEKTLKVDVRIIAATNRNLEEAIAKGTFRQDLYYRLNVVSIKVPPLRERKEDILLLSTEFLSRFAKKNSKNVDGFTAKAKSMLFNYDWPGNIRELQNCIESAVVMTKHSVIDVDDLPSKIAQSGENKDFIQIPIGSTLDQAEKIIIANTLSHTSGNKTKAADVLGIGRKTLLRKLQEESNE
ncbi:MAG: sigma-54 dependent transcriptional regulator [Sphaerochaetaceae bacterium]|jgi:DNA-binding NtrC family response regulator|nr:sigma-54 dependent transcriptional regulator [Sphaerochaetaceae bacterium]MDD3163779.1 sigma-54 dependent transcriptional regulator [Sphaerochaetaceae bacterium]MDD4007836.1 sigma-54 dependent transcriptional regulator [Sphaerochaetaceae bacterium]MDD4397664.1 sigma-54 dependent transcriptional regulator [Sphaerochaetaceae bacterium]